MSGGSGVPEREREAPAFSPTDIISMQIQPRLPRNAEWDEIKPIYRVWTALSTILVNVQTVGNKCEMGDRNLGFPQAQVALGRGYSKSWGVILPYKGSTGLGKHFSTPHLGEVQLQ